MYWDKSRLVTYIDTPSQIVLNVSLAEDFWQKANRNGHKWDAKNFTKPWTGLSPFDQEYFIIFNVAVGGVNGYFPDRGAKPWRNNSPRASGEFWDNKVKWMNTWKGDLTAMKIDYVKVWSNNDTVYTKL
jgi:hypothetical protein